MLVLLAVPVVPAVLLGEGYTRWLWAADGGPTDGALLAAGVGLLAADILIPVPSGPLLALLAARLGWPVAALAGAVGLTAGGLAGYLLARWGGRSLALRWVEPGELARWERAIERNGAWLLLASRPAPVVAEAVVLAAGLGRMPVARLLLWLVLGNSVTSLVFSVVGSAAARYEVLPIGVAFCVALPALLLRVAQNRHANVAPDD